MEHVRGDEHGGNVFQRGGLQWSDRIVGRFERDGHVVHVFQRGGLQWSDRIVGRFERDGHVVHVPIRILVQPRLEQLERKRGDQLREHVSKC